MSCLNQMYLEDSYSSAFPSSRVVIPALQNPSCFPLLDQLTLAYYHSPQLTLAYLSCLSFTSIYFRFSCLVDPSHSCAAIIHHGSTVTTSCSCFRGLILYCIYAYVCLDRVSDSTASTRMAQLLRTVRAGHRRRCSRTWSSR